MQTKFLRSQAFKKNFIFLFFFTNSEHLTIVYRDYRFPFTSYLDVSQPLASIKKLIDNKPV